VGAHSDLRSLTSDLQSLLGVSVAGGAEKESFSDFDGPSARPCGDEKIGEDLRADNDWRTQFVTLAVHRQRHEVGRFVSAAEIGHRGEHHCGQRQT